MNSPPFWTTHAATLLVPTALAWLAARRRKELPAQPWHPGIDPALAAATGLVWALACFFWASRFPMHDGLALTADLADYCSAVQYVRAPSPGPYPINRSPAVAALLGPLATHLGIMGALQAAALASTAVVGTALYLWGRAATDRREGAVAAVILGLVAQPLVTLGRQLNFYPETTAAAALGGAAVAMALRHGSPATLLLGGAGAGLVLVTEPRLLPLGLALAGAALLAALPGPLSRAPLRIGLALAPVIASWWLPAQILHRFVAPTEPPNLRTVPMAGYVSLVAGMYRDHDARLTAQIMDASPHTDLAWGNTTFADIRPALELLAQLSQVPLEPRQLQVQVLARQAELWAFLAVVIALGLVGALASWREPRRLLAGSVLPALYLAHLVGALQLLPRPRTAAAGSLAIPILLASGLWAVGPRKAPPRVAALVALLLALASAGMFPSWLHPQASWRALHGPGAVHPDAWSDQLATVAQENPRCAQGLAWDQEHGLRLSWPGPQAMPTPPPQDVPPEQAGPR